MAIFYSHECQPSGHQLSHQTIAKLWHLMVGQGLRARMSAVVQLWSKTTTANLWLMTHKKIVCVITVGTNGQDFCFARFYDHNLKTIHFKVDLNQDFVFETRSSVFYVLSGSDGQSIVMEKRLKQFEQLSECKPSPDLPSNTGLKTIESKEKHAMASDKTSLNTSKPLNTNLKTHLHEYRSLAYRGFHRISEPLRRPTTLPKTSLKPKTRSSILTNGSVIDLQLDPILDTKIEKCFTQLSKSLQLMDSSLNQLILDVRHKKHTNQEDQPIDISLSSVVESDKTVDTPAMGDDNQSITGSDSDRDTKSSYRTYRRKKRFRRGVPLPESVREVSEKLALNTTLNGHELATDDHSDLICDTEEEDSEAIVTKNNDNQCDGGIDDYDKGYDIKVGYGLTFWRRWSSGAHNYGQQMPQRRVIPVDSETYNRFREVMGDRALTSKFESTLVLIRNDSSSLELDVKSDYIDITPNEMAEIPVISVESWLYKQIRDLVAIYGYIMSDHEVIITTGSKQSGLAESGKIVDTPVIVGDMQAMTGSDSDKDTKDSYLSHRRRRRQFRRGVPLPESVGEVSKSSKQSGRKFCGCFP
ncbi:unnamed protein product [Medioppia subpectinata]|uniref:Uncharacterized protein n=1 Tax=Medioppia subpectinata TaxID=1979941 RepID=A0A7R9PWF5_9ACAR|nr:unnamed protein product [Medioppia subpectinata]CAG2102847.1 unnamed protein product [Medioppia subpectinata]